MLDIREIEANPEKFKKFIELRKGDAKVIDEVLGASKTRRNKISESETLKAQQNLITKEVAALKREGKNAEDKIRENREAGDKIKALQEEAALWDQKVTDMLLRIPNKLHESVPAGKSEAENVVVRKYGEKPKFNFEPKWHDDLAVHLRILDFERAAKITGSRFSIIRGQGALLERALTQFMLDLHTREHGYEEIQPPLMVNEQAMIGTGQFPKFREDVFHVEGTGYHLIPTAEVPVTNYYAGEILEEEMLPQKFAAFTPCFRSEAGSAGRDTKGMIRQHQFNKVEVVQFVHPEKSYEAHEQLTKHAEEVLKRLELPYELMLLCSGDIGFGAAKCHDINVWLPGQGAYREISSCSNFEDYQARRANIRFRPKGGKPQFVHTLNGSGLAVGRTWIAVLENYQNEDGSVRVPKVLQKYMDGLSLIQKP